LRGNCFPCEWELTIRVRMGSRLDKQHITGVYHSNTLGDRLTKRGELGEQSRVRWKRGGFLPTLQRETIGCDQGRVKNNLGGK